MDHYLCASHSTTCLEPCRTRAEMAEANSQRSDCQFELRRNGCFYAEIACTSEMPYLEWSDRDKPRENVSGAGAIYNARIPQFTDSINRLKVPEEDFVFTCDFPDCGNRFSKISHSCTHRRIHTGEKPFICPWKECSWKFRRPDELKRHFRRHTGEKPYRCPQCERQFSRSDHRTAHLKKVHSKTQQSQATKSQED